MGPWFLWSGSPLRMSLANKRTDMGPEDQSEARRDGGPWQPPRVTVSQSPCPGSSLWQTPDQDRWGRANCSCHLPKRGKFMVVFLFNISFFCRWKVNFYARKHNSLNIFDEWTLIFSSAAFQTRENYLFYNEAGSQATLHRCWIFFQLGIRVW